MDQVQSVLNRQDRTRQEQNSPTIAQEHAQELVHHMLKNSVPTVQKNQAYKAMTHIAIMQLQRVKSRMGLVHVQIA